jgi:ornithine cyclodeaminase/alanine dehydrogenase-like protein (mu-crystallin family)
MRAVRAFDAVTIVGRTPGRAQALADELAADVGGPEAVAGADVVCTCTTSAAPLFDGALLAPGTHVNAIGAYRPDLRELDDAAMRRATVVVETRASALAEAGDVIGAGLRPDELVELGAVLRGAAGRPDREAITVFKSVGLALEDLAVARAALG